MFHVNAEQHSNESNYVRDSLYSTGKLRAMCGMDHGQRAHCLDSPITYVSHLPTRSYGGKSAPYIGTGKYV